MPSPPSRKCRTISDMPKRESGEHYHAFFVKHTSLTLSEDRVIGGFFVKPHPMPAHSLKLDVALLIGFECQLADAARHVFNFYSIDYILDAALPEVNVFDASSWYPTSAIWFLGTRFHRAQQGKLADISGEFVCGASNNPRRGLVEPTPLPPVWVEACQMQCYFSSSSPSFPVRLPAIIARSGFCMPSLCHEACQS